MHVLTIVSFVIWCNISDSSCEKFIFRSEFILSIFRRLFFFRFLGLLSESSQVLFRWLISIFFFLFLAFNNLSSLGVNRLTLCINFFVLLTFLFRFFLFLFRLVFGWYRIKNSWRLYWLLSINKRCNIDNFPFVLI